MPHFVGNLGFLKILSGLRAVIFLTSRKLADVFVVVAQHFSFIYLLGYDPSHVSNREFKLDKALHVRYVRLIIGEG